MFLLLQIAGCFVINRPVELVVVDSDDSAANQDTATDTTTSDTDTSTDTSTDIGDTAKGTGDTGSTTYLPPKIAFTDAVDAESATATLPTSVVDAHAMVETWLATSAVVLGDDAVADITQAAGVPGKTECWSRPQFPRWEFTLDLSGCSKSGITGAIDVSDHPAGYIVFDYSATIGGRVVTGAISHDDGSPTVGAPTLSASAADPSKTDDVAVDLGTKKKKKKKKKKSAYVMTIDGWTAFEGPSKVPLMWGSATVEAADTVEVVLGGTDATGFTSTAPASGGLELQAWDASRCAHGMLAYDTELSVTTATVDLDDLLVDKDGIDDPTVELDVSALEPSAVQLQVERTGVSTLTVALDEPTTTLAVPASVWQDAIAEACTAPKGAMVLRCKQLVAEASKLADPIDVQIDEDDLATLLDDLLNDLEASGWCTVP